MSNYSTSPIDTQFSVGNLQARGREEHDCQKPPTDNMGVKNSDGQADGQPVTFHVDYLRVTAWIDYEAWQTVYNSTIAYAIGEWIDTGRGGRFYKRMLEGHLGARLYCDPSIETLDPRQITIELPGKACQYLGWERVQAFYIHLWINSDRVSVTRLDLAFDNAPFTVSEFWDAVHAGDCRTYARRDTFKLISNPYETRENGVEGCSTVYVGKRESLRLLRVYDKHGQTRVELEVHDDKANQVANHLFDTGGEGSELMDAVYERSMGHLRDFIDVTRDWWDAFTAGILRAFQTLSNQSPKEIDTEKVLTWLYKQVSSAFSVAVDIFGEDTIESILRSGRAKRLKNAKYRVMLSEVVV